MASTAACDFLVAELVLMCTCLHTGPDHGHGARQRKLRRRLPRHLARDGRGGQDADAGHGGRWVSMHTQGCSALVHGFPQDSDCIHELH